VLSDGRQVSRVNILGVKIGEAPQSPEGLLGFIMEDGTGAIAVGSFEPLPQNTQISIGDIVLVIGRVREFNGTFLVAPEIIKRVNNKRWLEIRKKELDFNPSPQTTIRGPIPSPIFLEPLPQGKQAYDLVYEFIEKNDKGEGVDIESVLAGVKGENLEQVIEDLKKEGEVFEIHPGKLKTI
ncbi:hypothetical protein HZB01_00475, partial [Candidatus Woesearchaeota archaeon]|nr:hypothetical protein [Candidatus Woesearchaeota archaeon]